VALLMRYYGDVDYAAMGEALGVTVGTVGASLEEALAALRGSLKEAERCRS
jgi:DNA-directed RNA polymerase specialized sigma24 family protein